MRRIYFYMTPCHINHGLRVPWEMSSSNPKSNVTWKVPKHNIKSLLKKKCYCDLSSKPSCIRSFRGFTSKQILSSVYIHAGIPPGSNNALQIPYQISLKWNGPDETVHSVFGPYTLPKFRVLTRKQIHCFCNFVLSCSSHSSYHVSREEPWVVQEKFVLNHLKTVIVTESYLLN